MFGHGVLMQVPVRLGYWNACAHSPRWRSIGAGQAMLGVMFRRASSRGCSWVLKTALHREGQLARGLGP